MANLPDPVQEIADVDVADQQQMLPYGNSLFVRKC